MPPPLQRLSRWAVAIQVAIGAFLAIATFGFDKPSTWELDFDDMVRIGSMFLLSSLVALILVIRDRDKTAIAISLCAVPVVAVLVVLHDVIG